MQDVSGNVRTRPTPVVLCPQADYYSFTLSWSRLLPDGNSSQVNEEGVAYYNNLLDSLVSSGLTAVVTLHHWDLPQALQDKGGWLNEDTAHRFLELARLCFSRFGDRVSMPDGGVSVVGSIFPVRESVCG